MQTKLQMVLLLIPMGAVACGQAIEGDLVVPGSPDPGTKLEQPNPPEMPPEGVPTEPLIIGSVNWQEVNELADTSAERVNSRGVAYLSIPSRGSRCTAFLITPDVLMTNNHCIPDANSARSATAYFRREAGLASSQWAPYDCSTFLGTSSALDYTLIQCSGRPGDIFTVVPLLERSARSGEDIYVLHQNCDFYFDRGCNPLKKYSPGRVTRVLSTTVRHDADTLGGSSGSPIFASGDHAVIAIHNSGIGNNGQGRGTENGGVPMSRIVPSIRSNFPGLSLGGTPPPPPPSTGDGFEPNDTAADATDATLGLAATGLSIGASDVDVFKVELPAGGDIQVNLSFIHAQGDIDVTLHAGSLGSAAIANADSASNDESMSAPGLSAGSYYVRVYGYNGATNNYDISLSVQGAAPPPPPPPPADLEPNDSRATAAVVPVPFTQSGLRIDASDEDWYAVTSNGGTVSFQIDFSHAQGDLDIYLFNASGVQINRSISTANQELINTSLPAGTYTLRVLGYRGATGDYDLSIQ